MPVMYASRCRARSLSTLTVRVFLPMVVMFSWSSFDSSLMWESGE